MPTTTFRPRRHHQTVPSVLNLYWDARWRGEPVIFSVRPCCYHFTTSKHLNTAKSAERLATRKPRPSDITWMQQQRMSVYDWPWDRALIGRITSGTRAAWITYFILTSCCWATSKLFQQFLPCSVMSQQRPMEGFYQPPPTLFSWRKLSFKRCCGGGSFVSIAG